MNKGLVKLVLGVLITAVIAYAVSSYVVKKDDKRTSRKKLHERGTGARWQTPVALAASADDMLNGYAFSGGGLAG